MVENSHINREKLAQEIVQVWSEDELRRFVVHKLMEEYKAGTYSFNNDWLLIFGNGGK